MIPRHRPPFGTWNAVLSGLRSLLLRQSVSDLEAQACRLLSVQHAVWLPSARYGITRAIQCLTAPDAEVFCPVFNCGAVHHAVAETDRKITFVDARPGSFLMSCEGSSPDGHAVVLSEMFGHRFADAALQQPRVDKAALRVFDLAMGIPESADMGRMQDTDVTVISFGLGKSLYAGWGGMALTNSDKAAAALRSALLKDLLRGSWPTRQKWNANLLLRTLAHEQGLYRLVRSRQNRRAEMLPGTSAAFSGDSHEWRRPVSAFHLQRVAENLRLAEKWAAVRREQAREYHQRLAGVHPHLCPPDDSDSDAAVSHFSVRVPAGIRSSIQARLWNANIDVGTLFPFPGELCDPTEFPNAADAAAEVLNLPVSNLLTTATIAKICAVLTAAVSETCPLANTRQALAA